jgi:hypothetical protein
LGEHDGRGLRLRRRERCRCEFRREIGLVRQGLRGRRFDRVGNRESGRLERVRNRERERFRIRGSGLRAC